MTTDAHHVTAQHIHGLTAASRMRGNRTILADTDDGLRYVAAGDVFSDGAKVRRVLLTLDDLRDDVRLSGLNMSTWLRQNAARVAGDLNTVLAGEDQP